MCVCVLFAGTCLHIVREERNRISIGCMLMSGHSARGADGNVEFRMGVSPPATSGTNIGRAFPTDMCFSHTSCRTCDKLVPAIVPFQPNCICYIPVPQGTCQTHRRSNLRAFACGFGRPWVLPLPCQRCWQVVETQRVQRVR